MKTLEVEVITTPSFTTPIITIFGDVKFKGTDFYVRARRCIIRHGSELALTWHDSMPTWRRITLVHGAELQILIDGEGSIVLTGGTISGDFVNTCEPPWFPISAGLTTAIVY